MTTFRAHFDGRVLIPDGPVNLPTDCILEVRASPAAVYKSSELPLRRLAEILSQLPDNPDSPTDGSPLLLCWESWISTSTCKASGARNDSGMAMSTCKT
jgi:hypothetical protein